MGYEIGPKRGVANHYGPRETDNQFGGQDNTNGKIKSVSYDFDFDKLPAQGSGNLEYQLPANTVIVSAHLVVKEAFTSASTHTMKVGLTTTAGVVVDDDGLIAAAQATNALITTKGSYIKGAGALVDKTIGTAACEVTVASSHTLTAGKGKLIVHYIYN